MRTVTTTTEIYRFHELSAEAQDKACDNLVQFYLYYIPYEDMSPAMRGAVDKANELQTPWFTGNIIWELCKEEIIQEAIGYEYLENGEVYL